MLLIHMYDMQYILHSIESVPTSITVCVPHPVASLESPD